MPPPRATLDTCVLFPSRLRDTLLDLADASLYECRWSAETLVELRRNLIDAERLSVVQAQRLVSAFRLAFPDATVPTANYRDLLSRLTNHPKDRHVLAAAVVSGSDLIVTSNLKDFQTDALDPWGVAAYSPDDFLLEIFDRHPQRLLRLLHEQAERYHKPAMTLETLLEKLGVFAPSFVARVRGRAR